MLTTESDLVMVKAPAEKLFNYLGNFNNFGRLMPPQISNWKSTENECSFTIQGMADIELFIIEKVPCTLIHIGAKGKSPVPLEMKWEFMPANDQETQAKLSLQADVNPVMAMMAKAPLQNFVNMLAKKLVEVSENGFAS